MYFVIWLVLIILGIFYRKSKKLAFFEIVFAVLIFTTLDGGPDYNNYVSLFHNINSSIGNIINGNVLFNLMLYIFGLFGNYNIALFFISAISMAILYKAVSFYTENVSFVLAIYLIAPFMIDIIQIKNFMAMAVWFYFSRYLFKAYLGESKSYNVCIYLLGVTISVGFHFSFVIMYFFALVPFIKIKKILILICLIAVMLGLMFGTNIIDYIVEMISKSDAAFFVTIISKFKDYKANFNYGRMRTRFIITLALYVGMIVMLWFIYLFKKKSKLEKENYAIQFLIVFDIIIAVIFPFMLYSMEIYRVQRNVLILNYAIVAAFTRKKVMSDGKIHLISVLSICFCLIISIYYLCFDCIYWNYEDVFVPGLKL